MQLLLADALDPTTVEALEALGHSVGADPSLNPDTLAGALAGVDVLVVRSTKVPAGAIEAADRLQLIIRAGAGTNTIDVQAAADNGVYVANVPGRNAVAVAELTLGLLLAIDRRIVDNVTDLRAGQWNKKAYSQAGGLLGRTIGVVGLGSIGLAVAERAVAFGLKVTSVRRPNRDPAIEQRIRSLGIRLVDSLEELVETADIVSLHIPAAAETKGLFGADLLGRMKQGAIFINTARGDVVDAAALGDAIEKRGLRVGLDVYPDEPSGGAAEWTSELASHPSVVGTHHIGASTDQAQAAIAAGVVEIIEAYGQGEILNCVNLEERPLGTCTLHVRHYDRVGVLASVLAELRGHDLNVKQMENRVFEGSNAAVAIIHVAGTVDDELLDIISGLENVIHATRVGAN
ncbi:MAG: hydroxyacid dehydrogenase [Actinomycetia bacterium]|nr:hydroxyacid dehydrogenase [Actinomycetes bacterium]MCP3910272.1 hydroxyacid dehydrogenase [Actinomycetes bacterium]MCP4084967.1 hydroxyacid dehydrogenase [Actinomycetes bacterium]